MYVTIPDVKAFGRAVKVIARATGKAGHVPCCRTCAIAARGAEFALRATDLDLWAWYRPADVVVETAGACTCAIDDLSDAFGKAVKGVSATMSLDADGYLTVMRSDGLSARVPTKPADGNRAFLSLDDFPEAPLIAFGQGAYLPAATWKAAYDACSGWASTDPARHQLNHIGLIPGRSEHGCYMVTSDGKRLAEYRLLDQDYPCYLPAEGIIVQMVAAHIVAEIADGDIVIEHVAATPDNGPWTSWTADGVRVIARDIEGTLPDYRSLVPTEFGTVIHFPRPEKVGAALKAIVGKGEPRATDYFAIEIDRCGLIVNHGARKAHIGTEVTWTSPHGPNHNLGLAREFTLDAFASIGKEPATLGLQAEGDDCVVKGAVVFQANGFRGAMMPIMIKK